MWIRLCEIEIETKEVFDCVVVVFNEAKVREGNLVAYEPGASEPLFLE